MKKFQADTSLCGRSMVEMLGVLAIIGVLSVGGIAGYHKAITKYRLNKFSSQISDLMNTSIITASKFDPPAPNEGTSSAYQLVPYYIKLNNIPEDMIRQNDTANLYTVYGTKVNILYINWGTRSYIEMVINLVRGDKDQCFTTFNILKELNDDLYVVNLYKVTEDDLGQNLGAFEYVFLGNHYCGVDSRACLKDQTLNDYEEICRKCEDDNKTCQLRISYALRGIP